MQQTINYYLEIKVEWEFSEYIHIYRKRFDSPEEAQVVADKYYCASKDYILDELYMEYSELQDVYSKYLDWPVEALIIGDIIKVTTLKEVVVPCLTTGLRRSRR